MNLISEHDECAIRELEGRLANFYSTTHTYNAFIKPSCHPPMWELIVDILRSNIGKNRFRILEIGAGRSGFHQYLAENISAELRETVHLCCQDITAQNAVYLEENADEVIIEDIDSIEGQWDVITHSYVLEHVARPKAFLSKIFNLLRLGGYHIFQCPRYDLPTYTPPSMDHLRISEKIRINILRALTTKGFLIIDDPSVFYLPFLRDRDAVHLVSKKHISMLHTGYGEVSCFDIPSGGIKDSIVKKFLTLKMQIRKTENKTMEATA